MNELAIKRITALDISILEKLYYYRALTIEQLSRMHKKSKQYMYLKLHHMRESGFVEKKAIHNDINDKKVRGWYMKITTKGLKVLKERGYTITRRADKNDVRAGHIYYVLAANDILLDIKDYGWELEDGREVKAKYNRNRGELLDGAFVSPSTNQSYVFYVLLGVGKGHVIPIESQRERLLKELQGHSNSAKNVYEGQNVISDYIFFCKEKAWYSYLVSNLYETENGLFVARSRSVKIMPLLFGKYLMRILNNPSEEENFINELLRYLEREWQNKRTFEPTIYGNFSRSYLFDGDTSETYVVNMLDMDMKKLFKISYYNDDRFREDGARRVIVLIPEGTKEVLKRRVNYRHVDYVEVPVGKAVELLSYV